MSYYDSDFNKDISNLYELLSKLVFVDKDNKFVNWSTSLPNYIEYLNNIKTALDAFLKKVDDNHTLITESQDLKVDFLEFASRADLFVVKYDKLFNYIKELNECVFKGYVSIESNEVPYSKIIKQSEYIYCEHKGLEELTTILFSCCRHIQQVYNSIPEENRRSSNH